MSAQANILMGEPGLIPREGLGRLAKHHASSMDHILASMHEIAGELDPGACYLDYVRMNDQFDLHDHLLTINGMLNNGQWYIGRVDHVTGYESDEDLDTYARISRLRRASRYIAHRVLPKLKYTRSIYFKLTGGRSRRISKTEALGRLKFTGFEIMDTLLTKNEMVFVARKNQEPRSNTEPHYGPMIRLQRLVRNGKITGIYKFRTMYPYAEHIQDYIYELNSLAKGGKINDDFRISSEGRLMRKFFIDELPMIINLVKGDIKLIGVRPLTEHYFNLYTNNMQSKRIKHKPGLLPPFYAEKQTPESLEDVMVSEIRYLFMYERNPLKTDVEYFFRIVHNILGRKVWSN